MSLRNRCNQLNKTLYQLFHFYRQYKMKDEIKEISDLIFRLNDYPKFIEQSPELAQQEIQFIIDAAERLRNNIKDEAWSNYVKGFNASLEAEFEE